MIKKSIWLLILALALPSFGQVATQNVVNTATIYATNSPVTFNAPTTFNSNIVVNGTQTFNGNQQINGNLTVTNNLTVSNDFRAFGFGRIGNTLTLDTNLSIQGAVDLFVGANNGLQITRADNVGWLDLGRFSQNGGNADGVIRYHSANSLIFYSGTTNAVNTEVARFSGSNLFVVLIPLSVSNIVTSLTNNSSVYQVGGVTGFSGVVTNDIGPVTNIMFYHSGILTNLTRLP